MVIFIADGMYLALLIIAGSWSSVLISATKKDIEVILECKEEPWKWSKDCKLCLIKYALLNNTGNTISLASHSCFFFKKREWVILLQIGNTDIENRIRGLSISNYNKVNSLKNNLILNKALYFPLENREYFIQTYFNYLSK